MMEQTNSSSAMPEFSCHPAALASDRLHAECEVRFLRRSGPGGQHRNKVSTAVALHHLPTGVKAEASERRSQAENLAVALFRLRINLALHVRTVRPADCVPSGLWKSRCHGGRMEVSATHDDFPTMLAEAFDVLAACEFDPKPAAELLGCSTSQLLRLLKKEPQAQQCVNAERTRLGLHPLR
jgi:hypothetical protein